MKVKGMNSRDIKAGSGEDVDQQSELDITSNFAVKLEAPRQQASTDWMDKYVPFENFEWTEF